jgi:hypothetical protein
MLNTEALLAKLEKWEARMDDQYAKADATNNVMAAVATARAGIAATEAQGRIGPLAEIEARLETLEEDKANDA